MFLAGGGETVANRSFRLLFCAADCGWGAANCVDELIVEVEAGGAMNWAAAGLDAGAAAGAADWKSSKSSSSPKSLAADVATGCFPAALETGAGSSSHASKSATGSGALGFGGSFFTSRLAWLEDAAGGGFRRGGGDASSSPSSYSSNLSRRACVSVKPDSLPPNPPPSPSRASRR